MDGTAAGALDRGRDAYARRAWLEAHEALSRAEDGGALEAEDLELLAMAKLMLGRDDESIAILSARTIGTSSAARRIVRSARRPGSG